MKPVNCIDRSPVERCQRKEIDTALNTAQTTSLSITLREFEKRLSRLRVLLEHYEVVTRLTPDGVSRLRLMIDQQQAIIDELFRRFQLTRGTIDVVQSMIAELSIS
jgi:hypothetical protein